MTAICTLLGMIAGAIIGGAIMISRSLQDIKTVIIEENRKGERNG